MSSRGLHGRLILNSFCNLTAALVSRACGSNLVRFKSQSPHHQIQTSLSSKSDRARWSLFWFLAGNAKYIGCKAATAEARPPKMRPGVSLTGSNSTCDHKVEPCYGALTVSVADWLEESWKSARASALRSDGPIWVLRFRCKLESLRSVTSRVNRSTGWDVGYSNGSCSWIFAAAATS
jgi:hypothetical protein